MRPSQRVKVKLSKYSTKLRAMPTVNKESHNKRKHSLTINETQRDDKRGVTERNETLSNSGWIGRAESLCWELSSEGIKYTLPRAWFLVPVQDGSSLLKEKCKACMSKILKKRIWNTSCQSIVPILAIACVPKHFKACTFFPSVFCFCMYSSVHYKMCYFNIST